MKIMLDIDVVLDLLLARQPFAVEAKKLMQKAIRDEIEVYVTTSSINTLVYIMEKTIGFVKTRGIITNFLQIAKGIDIGMSDIQKAFTNLAITDTEDAILMQGAIKGDMDLILTRDNAFSQIEGQKVRVTTPSEYLGR
jgi:predicted nucleic acid-binding protein